MNWDRLKATLLKDQHLIALPLTVEKYGLFKALTASQHSFPHMSCTIRNADCLANAIISLCFIFLLLGLVRHIWINRPCLDCKAEYGPMTSVAEHFIFRTNNPRLIKTTPCTIDNSKAIKGRVNHF